MREFDAAFKARVHPRLAALGFAQRGRNHARQSGERTHVIHVQQHPRNTVESASFHLILMTAPGWRLSLEDGLGWGGDRAGLGDNAFPDQKGRHVVVLGWLTPARTDVWYDYRADDPASVEAALSGMLEDLEAHGLPWLDDPMRHGPRRWTTWDRIWWMLGSHMPPRKPARR